MEKLDGFEPKNLTSLEEDALRSEESYRRYPSIDDPYYPIRESNRGLVLIFNHYKFDSKFPFKRRKGSEKDVEHLEEVFRHFDFKVIIYQDIQDVTEKLRQVKEDKELLKQSDSLFVIVMTHGHKESYLYSYDKAYRVNSLWEEFYALRCPELAMKPKIFIIQACRGEDMSKRFIVQMDSYNEGTHSYSTPNEADILVVYSSIPGHVSFRDIIHGGWYIQEFCAEIKKSLNSMDLLSILVNVNRNVALKYEFDSIDSGKQMPLIENTLLRKIYFGSLNKNKFREHIPMDCENETRVEEFTKRQNFIVNLFQNNDNLKFSKSIELFLKENPKLNDFRIQQLMNFHQTDMVCGNEKVELKFKELILELMKEYGLKFDKDVEVNENVVSKFDQKFEGNPMEINTRLHGGKDSNELLNIENLPQDDQKHDDKVVNINELSEGDRKYYNSVETFLKEHRNIDADILSRLKLFQTALATSKKEETILKTKERIKYYVDRERSNMASE